MSTSNLNNGTLNDAPLDAAEYNKLPHIDHMLDAAEKNVDARVALLSIIQHYGLGNQFSVHLVHKHFDVPKGRVMVYKTVETVNHIPFVICTPMDPKTSGEQLRGLYYRASPDGNMAAYEYTTDKGPDVVACGDFVTAFAAECVKLGVENVFSLTVKKPSETIWSEFEFPSLVSTILIPEGTWMPEEVNNGAIDTY